MIIVQLDILDIHATYIYLQNETSKAFFHWDFITEALRQSQRCTFKQKIAHLHIYFISKNNIRLVFNGILDPRNEALNSVKRYIWWLSLIWYGDMFSRPCVNARFIKAACSKGYDPKQVPWLAFVILWRLFRPIDNILHIQRASRITLRIQINLSVSTLFVWKYWLDC